MNLNLYVFANDLSILPTQKLPIFSAQVWVVDGSRAEVHSDQLEDLDVVIKSYSVSGAAKGSAVVQEPSFNFSIVAGVAGGYGPMVFSPALIDTPTGFPKQMKGEAVVLGLAAHLCSSVS